MEGYCIYVQWSMYDLCLVMTSECHLKIVWAVP